MFSLFAATWVIAAVIPLNFFTHGPTPMNQTRVMTLLILACLFATTTYAQQDSAEPGKENREGWTRKDDGKIRLATPRGTKDGRVRGNLNVVADRVLATIETGNIQKLYTMSSPTELEVTIVLKSGGSAEQLARGLLLEMYDIVLDSDVRSCKIEFLHGEEWLEVEPKKGNQPTVHKRKPGPVIHRAIISATVTEKPKGEG